MYAMLTMAVLGAGIAARKGTEGSVIGSLLTAYLMITALIALRPPTPAAHRHRQRLDAGLMLVALAIGLTSVAFGVATRASPSRVLHGIGIPASAFLLHGVTSMVAGVGDLRMLHAGELPRAARLGRHIWRMCWALWIAAMSFFVGQAQVIPRPIRIPGLLVLPPLAVLLTMAYWLRRVRLGRAPEAIWRTLATDPAAGDPAPDAPGPQAPRLAVPRAAVLRAAVPRTTTPASSHP